MALQSNCDDTTVQSSFPRDPTAHTLHISFTPALGLALLPQSCHLLLQRGPCCRFRFRPRPLLLEPGLRLSRLTSQLVALKHRMVPLGDRLGELELRREWLREVGFGLKR